MSLKKIELLLKLFGVIRPKISGGFHCCYLLGQKVCLIHLVTGNQSLENFGVYHLTEFLMEIQNPEENPGLSLRKECFVTCWKVPCLEIQNSGVFQIKRVIQESQDPQV